MKRTKDRVEKQTYQKEGEEFFGNIGVPKKTFVLFCLLSS